MANYTSSHVLSIRIDADLLAAVRERAKAGGRSLSGEIVHVVREQIEAGPTMREKARPITGWLRHLDTLETHTEFREARAQASAKLRSGVRRKARQR